MVREGEDGDPMDSDTSDDGMDSDTSDDGNDDDEKENSDDNDIFVTTEAKQKGGSQAEEGRKG
jgi:hypothetical protein